MRYLSLAEALVVAESVTGIDAAVLSTAARLGLLESALHAPQAAFGGHELYPEFLDKSAVLAVRIARNHPLPDGNKRLAWGCLIMFCALNGRDLHVSADDAVKQMLAVANGEVDEAAMAAWLSSRVDQPI
ncbi:MAG: type II toxin-antitoxin system death-on-curing family toxin [Candidatus Dormibacteraceae bacterium]